MSQCVPTWCSSSDHEVAELTWENGQLAMHGLAPPRVSHKPLPSSWEKPRAGGTLESIVDQATATAASSSTPKAKSPSAVAALAGADILVPWLFEGAEALVPCSIQPNDPLAAAAAADSAPPVSAGEGTKSEKAGLRAAREKSVDARGRCIPERSVTGSAATFGGNSTRPVTVDACETGFTSTTSPGNTINTTAADDHHSFSQAKPQTSCDEKGEKAKRKSSVSTKRSCAAAIHNQSERKRRDKINQRMKTLQKLVPNSSKTDKASMLDEVIDYLKQLQAQVQMMGRMNMSPMMLPMAMQGQLQMPIMAPTGVNMGMGMGIGMNLMDMNALECAHVHRQVPPLLHPAAFMPQTSRDGFGGDRVPMTIMLDPMFAYVNCQSQPMTLDAYSRMAALYQQLHQPPPSSSKV